MLYSVDRIEEDIAILENLQTKELVEVSTRLLPTNIKDGTIIRHKDNSYILDEVEQTNTEKRIKDKFERLKNLNNN